MGRAVGSGKLNAFLCGLRTSVFFVIYEVMRGFSFNRYSRLGVGHAFETQAIFSRGDAESAEERKGRASMAGGFHSAFPPRTPRLRVRYCLACYWLLDPTLVAPLGAGVLQRQVMWLAALAS